MKIPGSSTPLDRRELLPGVGVLSPVCSCVSLYLFSFFSLAKYVTFDNDFFMQFASNDGLASLIIIVEVDFVSGESRFFLLLHTML